MDLKEYRQSIVETPLDLRSLQENLRNPPSEIYIKMCTPHYVHKGLSLSEARDAILNREAAQASVSRGMLEILIEMRGQYMKLQDIDFATLERITNFDTECLWDMHDVTKDLKASLENFAVDRYIERMPADEITRLEEIAEQFGHDIEGFLDMLLTEDPDRFSR